jgi:ATP-dependent Clp protease ATP-binding subunit ClpC
MWQRFTEKARKVVFLAREEATSREHGEVAPDHFLLALVGVDETVALRLLHNLGVERAALRARAEECAPLGGACPGEELELNPAGKHLIDLAYGEARRLNNNYIGTEHFLLALAAQGGRSAMILRELGADLDPIRAALAEVPRDDPG